MKEILEWLQSVERKAMELYKQATEIIDDKRLQNLFKHLAKDEEMHIALLDKAEKMFAEKGQYPEPSVFIDAVTKNRVDKLLLEFQKQLKEKSINTKALLELVVKIESCEWNDIFVYIMDLCSELTPSFQQIPAQIESHKKNIDCFLDNLPEDIKPEINLKNLAVLWNQRFLIVDDEESILHFLESVFSMHGVVDAVRNGKEALEKINQFYYDIIFSDSDMPVMDGIEFLAKASVQDKTIKERFVFCSGNPSQQLLDFCRQQNIRYLQKPVSVDQIQNVIREITIKTF